MKVTLLVFALFIFVSLYPGVENYDYYDQDQDSYDDYYDYDEGLPRQGYGRYQSPIYYKVGTKRKKMDHK